MPDYMSSVTDGAFYGWPWSFCGRHVGPRVIPRRPDMVAKEIKLDYGLSSHVAPLGITFYDGAAMPQFRGGAFVGEHGSWDRGSINGYKVIFVPFANSRPSGMPTDVVTGFIDRDGHARGHPVGVTIDAHGALLIADDVGHAIWRVTSTGAAKTVASR